jgi:hypothetical protein
MPWRKQAFWASGAVAWIGNIMIYRSDLKRDEIAYIYDVRKLQV